MTVVLEAVAILVGVYAFSFFMDWLVKRSKTSTNA